MTCEKSREDGAAAACVRRSGSRRVGADGRMSHALPSRTSVREGGMGWSSGHRSGAIGSNGSAAAWCTHRIGQGREKGGTAAGSARQTNAARGGRKRKEKGIRLSAASNAAEGEAPDDGTARRAKGRGGGCTTRQRSSGLGQRNREGRGKGAARRNGVGRRAGAWCTARNGHMRPVKACREQGREERRAVGREGLANRGERGEGVLSGRLGHNVDPVDFFLSLPNTLEGEAETLYRMRMEELLWRAGKYGEDPTEAFMEQLQRQFPGHTAERIREFQEFRRGRAESLLTYYNRLINVAEDVKCADNSLLISKLQSQLQAMGPRWEAEAGMYARDDEGEEVEPDAQCALMAWRGREEMGLRSGGRDGTQEHGRKERERGHKPDPMAQEKTPARHLQERLACQNSVLLVGAGAMEVEGKQVKTAIIDTGAQSVMLGKGMAERLGLMALERQVAKGMLVMTAEGGEPKWMPYTRTPIELTLLPGGEHETRIRIKCGISESEGFDVLVGTEMVFAVGMSICTWTEKVEFQTRYWKKEGPLGQLLVQFVKVEPKRAYQASAREALERQQIGGQVGTEEIKGGPRMKLMDAPRKQSVWQQPIRLVELFGGIGAGLAAVVKNGIAVQQWIYVEQVPEVRKMAEHHAWRSQAKFPGLLSAEVIWDAMGSTLHDVSQVGTARRGGGGEESNGEKGAGHLGTRADSCTSVPEGLPLGGCGHMGRGGSGTGMMSCIGWPRVLPVGAPRVLTDTVTAGTIDNWVALSEARAKYLRVVMPAALENLHTAQLRDARHYACGLPLQELPLQPGGTRQEGPAHPGVVCGRSRLQMGRGEAGARTGVRSQAREVGGTNGVGKGASHGYGENVSAAPGVSEEERRRALGNAMDGYMMRWLVQRMWRETVLSWGHEAEGGAAAPVPQGAWTCKEKERKQWTVGEAMSEEGREAMRELLDKHRKCFAFTLQELGRCKVKEMELKLNSTEPVFHRRRKMPHGDEEVCKEKVKELLEAGLIRRSESEYATPIVVAARKDLIGEILSRRMCGDYRALNKITIADRYPMPMAEEIFDKLADGVFFTTLDLRQGFREEDIKKTAFHGPDGLYEWLYMPIGLRNASAMFQRVMDAVLRDVECAACYIDDVVIFSTTEQQHLQDVGKTLAALEAAGLMCHPKKCRWGEQTVQYLGYEVKGGQIGIQQAKGEVLDRLREPKDKSGLRAVLGFLSYYRRFVPNFSKRAAALNGLLREDRAWEWREAQKGALQDLMTAVKTATVLQLPAADQPFTLYTKWSSQGMGGILCQEVKGEEKVVAYASRSCNSAEVQYSSYIGEGLAVVWAVEHFRVYLQGREFTLVTDH
ncbi:unnamed protein product [Closterium sp. NIES-54]